LINLGFTTEGRLIAVPIIPSSWGSQRGLIYTPSVGHNTGKRSMDVDCSGRRADFNRAHLVALQHIEDLKPWVEEHKTMIKNSAHKPMTEEEIFRAHNSSFTRWFKEQIDANLPPMTSKSDRMLLALSYGPAPNLMTYHAYDINGYTFYTEERDKGGDYQNSSITMVSDTSQTYL
jgi:hypothetical protein